ncbi:hypothetical protein MPER_10702 [Moniliophthora perniciosa FA553]|nr:hypothetical protein MPER_10702 [Moniliophthora perniciosa FA553]
MWQMSNVQMAVPIMFWRQNSDVPFWRFRREMDPFVVFLATMLSSGKSVGEVLYSNTDRLWIKALPYPHHIFQDELLCIAKAFRNITRLEITKYWSVQCLEDAILFLASFPCLENLQLQTLFLVDDNEDRAWEMVDSVTGKDGVLSALKEVWVPDVHSPYNMLALLGTRCSFDMLKKVVWITEGYIVKRLFDQTKGSWRRVSAMLRKLETLNISLENEAVGK